MKKRMSKEKPRWICEACGELNLHPGATCVHCERPRRHGDFRALLQKYADRLMVDTGGAGSVLADRLEFEGVSACRVRRQGGVWFLEREGQMAAPPEWADEVRDLTEQLARLFDRRPKPNLFPTERGWKARIRELELEVKDLTTRLEVCGCNERAKRMRTEGVIGREKKRD